MVENVMTHSFNNSLAQVTTVGSARLDSMSSADVFVNRKMLTNIRTVSKKMEISCDAGTTVVTQMRDWERYGSVWYHMKAICGTIGPI